MFDLEAQIRAWSDRLRGRGNFREEDVEELQGHLRDEIDDLTGRGLATDEAFLVAVKRLGNTDTVSQEFAKVNTESLWKQLMLEPADPERKAEGRREMWLVVVLSLVAGTLGKTPELFGIDFFSGQGIPFFRNMSLFVLPVLTFYFVWKRKLAGWRTWALFVPFAVAAVLINAYPSYEPYHNSILIGIHLPMALWLLVGLTYMGGKWSDAARRMDFVRFSGEAFIYSTLLMCGGFVLIGIIVSVFASLGIQAIPFTWRWVGVYGGAATLIVASYLVEAKRSIVENLAPVLAKLFSPLFLGIMLVFLGVMVFLGKSPSAERDFLIAFDLLLALVLGLVLYVISARPQRSTPDAFDYLNLALIVTALVVDVVALWAVVQRLSLLGFSANKAAALGENIVLLVNLSALAVLYVRFFMGKTDFARLERWQVAYLPVYSAWAAVVVVAFPPVFGFR